MRSQFSAQTLAEIFRDLFLAERSGVLLLHRGDEQKRVYFDKGLILFAESPLPEESLGAYLVHRGELSDGALAEAEANLNGTVSAADLAHVLVARELIGRITVAQAMRAIVDRVVQSVFSWETGSARFQEGRPPASLFDTDVGATAELILNGVAGMAGFDAIHEAMQGLDNRLRIRQPTPVPLHRLTLSAAHGFVLSRVDGNTSLRDLIAILPPGEEERAVRFLFGLLVMGVLEYEPRVGDGLFRVGDILRDHADRQALERLQEQTIRQAYGVIREQNPHDILGVAPSASPADIERAYEQVKSQFSRDRILPSVRDKYRTELTVIESRLIEAYLTLSQPARVDSTRAAEALDGQRDITVEDLNVRVEVEKAKSRVEVDRANRVADGYYAKGRKCLREGDFFTAIQYGKLAIAHNASDARYYSLVADCQARNPEIRWQRMAEENYSRATQLDPWNADYWVSLGRLYKRRGLKLRAKKQFEEALKLIPNKPEILEELASLD
jgi:tetratricopeptide (TPR) repeat protein